MSAQAPRTRSGGRLALACVAILAVLPCLFYGCASEESQLGEPCFKDQDCFSGFCLAQTCAFRLSPLGDAGEPEEGGESGASIDGSRDGAPAALDADRAKDAADATAE